MLILDIDHFKRVNDEHGHAAGDVVLIAFAQVLRDCVRESDLLCRFGGEEFVVLLPDTDSDGAAVLAERIRAAFMGQAIPFEHKHLTNTVSIGVAETGGERADMDEMLRRADTALYAAKHAGRNRVIRADCLSS